MFLSFPSPTKMFQFRELASVAGCQTSSLTGCPIRISSDQFLFANPRGFSQLSTSFFASKSLGIPHTPFLTFLRPLTAYCQSTDFISSPQSCQRTRPFGRLNSTRFEPTPSRRCCCNGSSKYGSYLPLKQGSRKEVFQPHLPVRLPCYDLAPVTSFALGRSFRSRTSGTPGFHGLTGGVYKARERIHRAMADARLLANPTSWRRVSASNPN